MTTYATWDWSNLTGTGKRLSLFNPVRHDPINTQESEAGYIQTAPQDVRGIWIFKIKFDLLLPSSFVYLVNFHHAHRGGVPFYFTWPFEMAGIPEETELAKPGGMAPWDSEIEVLAGLGPTFLCYWAGDEFGLKRLKTQENLYQVDDAIEIRQI